MGRSRADDDTTIDVGKGSATDGSRPERSLGEGSTLGRFELRQRLGAGGMGVVYRGHDPQLDRDVAIKVMRRGPFAREDEQRMLREARVMAQLSHPNLLPIYDVGTVDGSIYIAMELVRGQTLSQWLKTPGRSWQEIVTVFAQAGRGLAAAHDAAIVHRDFKPANVMVGDGDGVAEAGRVRVLDFGLARSATTDPSHPEARNDTDARSSWPRSGSGEGLTRAGIVMGTPAYMSPEQHAGETVDARSDQYSFCVALFRALYGIRPFEAENTRALAEKKRRAPPATPPRESSVPRWLYRVLARGLAADPDDRFASMHALLRALEHNRAGRRRWPIVASVGGVALVGGMAFTGATAPDSARCSEVTNQLAEVWNDQRSDALRTALNSTKVAYADDTWKRTHALLDDYASRWVVAREDTCEAATNEEAPSAVAVDLRIRCLDRRLDDFEALLSVLEESDRSMVAEAVAAAGRLEPVESCSDAEALEYVPDSPSDPSLREEVDAIGIRLSRVRALSHAGRYADASELGTRLVARARDTGHSPMLAQVLAEVGEAQQREGRYDASAQTLQEAYFLAVQTDQIPLAVEAGTALMMTIGEHQAKPDEAKTWVPHVRALVDQLDDPDAEAHLAYSLGGIHRNLGQFEEALESFQTVLQIRERTWGADDLRLCPVLGYIGIMHGSMGRFEDARAYLERSLEIAEAQLGPDHPRVASALVNAANVDARTGNLDRAIARYRRAIAIDEATLGTEHPSMARSILTLGNTLCVAGDCEAGLVEMNRALAIAESKLGPQHPLTAMCTSSIGNARWRRGELDAALKSFERARDVFLEISGPDHPSTATAIHNVGMILSEKGDQTAAIEQFEQALAVREKALGKDHFEVAETLFNLGIAHKRAGRPQRASDFFERSLTTRERAFGPEHPHLAQTLLELAELDLMAGRDVQAVARSQRAVDILDEGGPPPDLAKARFALARALVEAGQDSGRAVELARQAHSALEELEDRDAAGRVEAWLRERDRRG